jgi:cytochrome c
MHRGVVGRKVGTAAGFAYSPALRDASVVWAGDTLDRWLTNPQAFIPGARMGFRVAEPADRADIIAYLKTQTAR